MDRGTRGLFVSCKVSAYLIMHVCPESAPYRFKDDSLFARSFAKATNILHTLCEKQCQTERAARTLVEPRKVFFIFGNALDSQEHGTEGSLLANEENRMHLEKTVFDQMINPFKNSHPKRLMPKVVYTVGNVARNRAWIRLGPNVTKEVSLDEYFDYCANIMHKYGHGSSDTVSYRKKKSIQQELPSCFSRFCCC